jgi:hypothetical protein
MAVVESDVSHGLSPLVGSLCSDASLPAAQSPIVKDAQNGAALGADTVGFLMLGEAIT